MAQTTQTKRRIDYEFVALVPIMGLALVVSLGRLGDKWQAGGVAEIAHQALVVCFFALLVALLLVRRPASATSRSWVASGAAYAGTFLPVLLAFNPSGATGGDALMGVSIALMLIGMAFSVYALSWLGRSFGVIPAARRLVREGPYRFVRHPLYAGELVALAGLVLGQVGWFSVTILVAAVALQTYRALQEELVLREAFPEYRGYSRDTARFIPGVV